MTTYAIRFPSDFDDYAWEVESKGVFWDVFVESAGKTYRLRVYDITRLSQDVNEKLELGSPVFFEPNVVVVPAVTRSHIERAVVAVAQRGFERFVAEVHG